MNLSDLFSFILVAGLGSVVTAPLVRAVSLRWRLLDRPGTAPHKRHGAEIPLGGGLVLVAGLSFAVLIHRVSFGTTIPTILAAALWVLVWGMIDDFRGLGVMPKLAIQILAAVYLIVGGVSVHLFRVEWLNILLSVLWIVGLINAFNFVDSMDGLALGLAGVASAFFMLVTIESGQSQLSILSAALLGATMGAFFHNTAPARVFMGDGGAQLMGLLLAAIGIEYNPVGLNKAVSWFVPIAVLGVPIFDATLVVVSRLRRRLPVYMAGHDHTYHRLIMLGLHPARAVLGMHLASVALGLIGFMTLQTTVVLANVIWSVVMVVGVLSIVALEARTRPEPGPAG